MDSAMFHVLGDRERDAFVRELGAIVAPGGLYCVLGDARQRPNDVYGVTPAELRERFEETGEWEVLFVDETVFERRWGTTPAYFACIRRR